MAILSKLRFGDSRQRAGQVFFLLQIHLAGDLDALRLRAAGSVHRLGQIAHRVAAERHVFDQPQYAGAIFDLDAFAAL